MLFIETTSPPPFYQHQLTATERLNYDKRFIGQRSQRYYLRRFASFDTANRLAPRWHWAAFFMTLPWLLYRKRYMDGIVYAVAGWSFIQLIITLVLVSSEFLIMPFVAEALRMPLRIGIGISIWFLWSVVVAMWADAYYYRVARREISEVIEDYQHQDDRMAKLKQEGGVSVIGLSLGFGFFAFVLSVVTQQFLPIYAKQHSQTVLYDVFDRLYSIQSRVETLYMNTGACPTNIPFSDSQKHRILDIDIVTNVESLTIKSDCIITATINNVPFPSRYLNDQSIWLYRTDRGDWQCLTSINQQQSPARCQ